MKHKFIQPVSMACTVEEYEKDLKPKLLAMGYKEKDMYRGGGEYNILCTNYSCRDNELWMGSDSQKTTHNRHFIDHYNPHLFLALASMTNAEYGGVGEWWVRVKETVSFTKGKLYTAQRIFNGGISFIDDHGKENKLYNFLNHFRKATKEELINHFTKQKTMENLIIKKSELKKVYDVACNEWQPRILEYAGRNMFGDDIELTKAEVDTMFKAATKDQIPVLEEVFGKRIEEKIDLTKGTLDGREVFKVDGNLGNSIISIGGRDETKDTIFINKKYYNLEVIDYDLSYLKIKVASRK